MPYVVNPKTQPNYDNGRNTIGHRTTVVIIVPTTTRRPLSKTPKIDTNDQSNGHGILFSPKNRNDGSANADNAAAAATSATVAGAAAAAVADAPAAITPTKAYSNPNIQSNINSIFVPASTSKYPIKQSTITEDFRERFGNFVEHWKQAFVYLSRK